MLGDIASQPVVRRLGVPLLSAAAVAELVGDSGIDPEALLLETGGNAFFVTEVVASGGQHLPATVQDAVLARVSRLSPQARLALESAAVIGSRIEPSLVHAMPDVSADSVDECVSAGMLRFEAPAYVFRHELVRQAVLSGVTPGRLGALHWQALDRLRVDADVPAPARAARGTCRDGRRRSGDPRVRRGCWRFRRQSRLAPRGGVPVRPRDAPCRPPRPRCTDRAAGATSGGVRRSPTSTRARSTRGLARSSSSGTAEGTSRWSTPSWVSTSRTSRSATTRHGTEFVDEAVELLEGTNPSPQLALTLARRGAHFFRASENAKSIPWLEQGLAMGREVGALAVVARALSATSGWCASSSATTRRGSRRSRRDCRSLWRTTSRTWPVGSTSRVA